MNYEDKVIRAKHRIEYLRKIHGLRKMDIYKAMGFSKQHYHKKYQEKPSLSTKSLMGITELLKISEYDLLHATDEEFKWLPIVKAYTEHSKALAAYENVKLGKWECEPFLEVNMEVEST